MYQGFCAGVLACVGAASVDAAIVFSNISTVGTLGPASAVTSPADIDFVFAFPAGTAGDPVDPFRAGSVVLTYDALSDAPIDGALFSALGAALGTGAVTIQTTVADLALPGVIANVSFGYDAANPPPDTLAFAFSRATSSFRVTTTITASAPDGPGFDVAQISLVEQFFVPAPSSALVMCAVGLAALRRRSRESAHATPGATGY